MTLKIIHHKESIQKVATEHLSLNIEKNLKTMFLICERIVNLAYSILGQINIETAFNQVENYQNNAKPNTFAQEKNNLISQDIKLKKDNLENLMSLFALLVGKKLSLLDAVAKATIIMQKISKLAQEFGVSLIDEKQTDPNTEILTDEDIDIMVQIVKDFGENQIRKDAKECRDNIQQKQNHHLEAKEIDVYNVYHDN